MICEICNQDPSGLKSCDHPKNGYCALFLRQAEKDVKSFGPKSYKSLKDLVQGDTFRYKNSADDDWHIVTAVDDHKLYYSCGNVPQSNHRVENVEVIVK